MDGSTVVMERAKRCGMNKSGVELRSSGTDLELVVKGPKGLERRYVPERRRGIVEEERSTDRYVVDRRDRTDRREVYSDWRVAIATRKVVIIPTVGEVIVEEECSTDRYGTDRRD